MIEKILEAIKGSKLGEFLDSFFGADNWGIKIEKIDFDASEMKIEIHIRIDTPLKPIRLKLIGDIDVLF